MNAGGITMSTPKAVKRWEVGQWLTCSCFCPRSFGYVSAVTGEGCRVIWFTPQGQNTQYNVSVIPSYYTPLAEETVLRILLAGEDTNESC